MGITGRAKVQPLHFSSIRRFAICAVTNLANGVSSRDGRRRLGLAVQVAAVATCRQSMYGLVLP